MYLHVPCSVAAERQVELRQLQEELQALKSAVAAEDVPGSSPHERQELEEQQQQRRGRQRIRRRHGHLQQQQQWAEQEQQRHRQLGDEAEGGPCSAHGSSSGSEGGWEEEMRHRGHGEWETGGDVGSSGGEREEAYDEEEELLLAVLSEGGGHRPRNRRSGGLWMEGMGCRLLHSGQVCACMT